MTNKLIAVFCFFIVASCASAKGFDNNDLATSSPIHSIIDLTSVIDDKAPVTINPGRFTEDVVTFRLPRVIQGSYEVSDFGNYIENFVALDYNGNTLEFEKIDINSWTITNAKELDKITYWVNDTYDIEQSGNLPAIFSPEGTNISPDNFMLNLHAFIGYFDSLKANSYTLDVIAPSDFMGTSALEKVNTVFTDDNKMVNSYFAPRYFDITDNPMMYGYLDVEEFKVDDINVVLSVYSPNKVHQAKTIKETVYKMMEAQKAYLGDIHTTDRYDIILFLSDGKKDSPTGYGALEHQKSTVTVLREWSSEEYLAKSIIDIVAHEFFHILTPLAIHSEDIHFFDYNNPTFSKHLWMYEGVTEYFAQHFQIYEGLISKEEFFNTMAKKINVSKRFDDTISFTEMSERIIEEDYAPNFYNVYLKGALIGMCLDILIREGSHGEKGLMTIMQELSIEYGHNKPFDEDAIIEEISEMTYPSVAEFFNDHVEGNIPIPYDQIFEKVGLTLTPNRQLKVNENAPEFVVVLRNKWLNIKGQLD